MRQNCILARRGFLKSGLAAIAATALPASVLAAWPDRPIRMVVPSAAGGSPDAICRILIDELSKILGSPIIIDNKPGAAGNIGTVDVLNAAPDGYTIGYANVGTLAINRSLFKRLPYDPEKLVPVSLIGQVQSALVVRNSLGVSTVNDLIAKAKASPGRLSMASAGNGTTGHLGGELFKAMTGTFIPHIPYRGSPQAIQDLIGGQVDLMFDNLSSIAPHIKGGRVKALGVTGRNRSALFPELPTIAEVVPGFETTAWGGIVAPPGTPGVIVQRLNAAINQALRTPSVVSRYAAIAFEPLVGPPQTLSEWSARETKKWAEVARRSGATLD